MSTTATNTTITVTFDHISDAPMSSITATSIMTTTTALTPTTGVTAPDVPTSITPLPPQPSAMQPRSQTVLISIAPSYNTSVRLFTCEFIALRLVNQCRRPRHTLAAPIPTVSAVHTHSVTVALENKFRKLPNPTSSKNDKLVHSPSSKELTEEQMQVSRHEASFNTADSKPANMIAAVESILNRTEVTDETKNLIRHRVSPLLKAHRPRNMLSKVERGVLKKLKADNDLVIAPADKGRSKVLVDTTDYIQKVKRLLENRQYYVPCKSSSIKTLAREINETLLAIENSGAIAPIDRRVARAQKTALARFNGLSKVHKEGAPLRSIVSLKGTPAYGLAKWLLRRLEFLTSDSDTTVSSSTQFLEKLKGVSLLPSDVMVSFGVTPLSTSILQDLAV
ncbi:hypothetical protein SprV_0301200300 [Sparganum proliferum]